MKAKFKVIAGTVIIVILLVGFIEIRPSVNIDHYKTYYINDTSLPKNGSVKVTFFGTTTLLLDDGETQLLIDGFFSRPSLWRIATSKISTDTEVVNSILSQYKIDRVKAIFVSHSHYDHAFDVAYVSARTKAKLYGSASTLNIGKGGGLTNEQVALYEPGKELQFGKFTVTVLLSKHSPATAINNDLGEVIAEKLSQPAKAKKYVEGGSYDFLIKHDSSTIYIKPSANYVEGMLNNIKADVLFLGTARMASQDTTYMNNYYQETVGMLKPKMVIPIHWDNFFKPFSENLVMMPKFMDKGKKAFDFIIRKTKSDNIEFKILQGGKSIVLFTKQ